MADHLNQLPYAQGCWIASRHMTRPLIMRLRAGLPESYSAAAPGSLLLLPPSQQLSETAEALRTCNDRSGAPTNACSGARIPCQPPGGLLQDGVSDARSHLRVAMTLFGSGAERTERSTAAHIVHDVVRAQAALAFGLLLVCGTLPPGCCASLLAEGVAVVDQVSIKDASRVRLYLDAGRWSLYNSSRSNGTCPCT